MSDAGSFVTSLLGRLERLDQIRQVWPNEAGNFTPWLCQPGNLSILSEALGMGPDSLEFEATEKSIGPFFADIICRDTADNSRVLIENQFGASDHDHLGKLLTYASGLDARTIVLIGERIREEHRAALDWLNDITDEQHNFFACELELWRIGDSAPAPRFNVVVQPNDWARTTRQALSEDLSDNQKLQLRYWIDVERRISAADGPLRAVAAQPTSSSVHGLGRSGTNLALTMSIQKKRLRVYAYLGKPDGKALFHRLLSDKAAIEEEIGAQLRWDAHPGRAESHISIWMDGADPADESDWPRQHDWLVQMAQRFHETLHPRLKSLGPLPNLSTVASE